MGEGGSNKPSSRSSTKTKRPSFFKVLVGDFTNQLRIPRAFLNHFNGKFPEESTLKSPTGRYWAVEIKKIEKDLFFHDGWKRFVKKHSLEFGDFLVFRYNGKCEFYVKIYGRNACEKEIVPPVISKKTNVESNSPKKRQKVDEKCAKVPRFNERDRDVKEKKNNVETISHKKKKKVHVATEKCAKVPRFNGDRDVKEKKNNVEPISHKKKKKLVHVATEKCAKVPRFNEYGREVEEKKNNVESSSHKKKKKVDVATDKCAKDSPRPRFNEDGTEVKEKKKTATSTRAYVKPRRLPIVQIEENDDVDPYSCFIAACRPCTRQSLTVPKKVAEENGFKKKETVKLRDHNNRLWQVKINRRCDGRFVLEQGWNAFWKEHNLGGGEICRFKFMQGLDNEISVEIFRGGFTEYQSKTGGFVESVRGARLKTESNVMVNPKKEPVEEQERRFILVKDESDDSSMWL